MPKTSKSEQRNPEVAINHDFGMVVIDIVTGEILEWPEREARTMDRMLSLVAWAKRQSSQWDQIERTYIAAVRRMMDEAGVEKVVGGDARASLVPGNKYISGGLVLGQWCRDNEFPPGRYFDLIEASEKMSTERFEELCTELGLDGSTLSKGGGKYVRVTPSPELAPAISLAPSRDT